MKLSDGEKPVPYYNTICFAYEANAASKMKQEKC